MIEEGIDISNQKTKQFTLEMINKAYKIITMSYIKECPNAPSEKNGDWKIPYV